MCREPQAAPDVRIGGGQRRRAPKIWRKLVDYGGLGACPLGKFFFKLCKMLHIGPFFLFCQAFGGAMAPPLEPPM